MAKFKTTRSTVRAMFPRCFRVGYCDLQSLLHYEEPIAYNFGVYGWNFDVYNVDGVAITTGYRNMCGDNIPYEIAREYEEKARAIVNNWGIPYDEKKAAVSSLLHEFLEKLEG